MVVQRHDLTQALHEAALRGGGSRIAGQILQPGDADFDAARRVWNAGIDRRPRAIVRCRGVADILAGVRVAREQGLVVAVRGGGHNVAGFGTCDDGLVIDLSRMRAVRVDPARRTARAEGGATWGDLDRACQAFGLATTGGTVADTGIGGLTLGGGQGWLMGCFGLSCDNLLSADLVTADGSVLVASEHEHPDLFWGLRGGGGNFGVVTGFEYRLHPVGPLLGGTLLFSLARAGDFLRLFRDVTGRAPDELT